MMENRYATRLFAEVARRLQADGHEIHWIAQNPMFVPTVGTSHLIPFPDASDLKPATQQERPLFDRIEATDRQIHYFGGDSRHYGYYSAQIEAIVDSVRPDAAFGESTQFYELLAIASCRRRGIQYLNPISIGYPQGRVCFLSYDGRDPFGGEGTSPPEHLTAGLIEAINAGGTPPDYMKQPPMSGLRRMRIRLTDWARITVGWYRGERFATPSPVRKIAMEFESRRARKRWDALSRDYSLAGRRYVLYAMHVQPECSIDVWGYPWSDQLEIIRRAAAALAVDGIALAVKPHPSAKYEITPQLCEYAATAPNLIAVPGHVSMREVFPGASGVLSVTGTILLEAVFAGKPAIAVGDNAMFGYPGIVQISTPDDVANTLRRLTERSALACSSSAIELYQWLHRVSYPGEIFEPLFSPSKLSEAHMEPVYQAFADALDRIPHAAGSA